MRIPVLITNSPIQFPLDEISLELISKLYKPTLEELHMEGMFFWTRRDTLLELGDPIVTENVPNF